MPLLALEEFIACLPAGGRLFGLDVGTKTIGLALSDEGRRLATPFATLPRKRLSPTIAALQNQAEQQAVVGLVVGYPLHMDGSAGAKTQSVRQFCQNLLRNYPVPITLWDERLTTIAAERTLLEADLSRARRRLIIDKVAAALILQGFLDRVNAP